MAAPLDAGRHAGDARPGAGLSIVTRNIIMTGLSTGRSRAAHSWPSANARARLVEPIARWGNGGIHVSCRGCQWLLARFRCCWLDLPITAR